MIFETPSDVAATIRAGDQVERVRGSNRARINNAANGMPPLDPEAAKQWGMNVNFNSNELAVQLQHARRQYYDAFLKTNNFFTVDMPYAPQEKRADWSAFVTTKLNKYLRDSLDYFELIRSTFACVVTHGIGVRIWDGNDADEKPLPRYVAIEDFRVPTDTETSFRNLIWFGVRHAYTPGELGLRALGPNSDKHWNPEQVHRLLDNIFRVNYQNVQQPLYATPEKLFELLKQNAGYYSSDAAPVISLWHFYYLDDSDLKNVVWKLKIIPDWNAPMPATAADPSDFIYDSGEDAFATELAHILHAQFGDLNNKAPFLYHSVRALGFLLMEPCYFSNLLRCKMLQHAFENMNIWLRVNDPSDRARAQKIELVNKGIIPPGIQVVPQQERHQIDSGFISSILANMRQLQAEASASYTQDIDNGTGKEMTATETMARVNQVNALMSGLINTAAHYERFFFMEICRRFCNNKSLNKDVKKFLADCVKFEIDLKYLDASDWDIEVEVSLGAGNPSMAQAQAQTLLGLRPMLPPAGQQEVLHKAILTFTGDPRLANKLVPNNEKIITNGQEWAIAVFGTLMMGVQIPVKQGISPVEQGETLLGLLSGKIANIEQAGNVCDAQELQGLKNCINYIGQLVQQVQQDETLRPVAKEMGDALGQLTNTVKGFEQRLMEQQQSAQQQADPAQSEMIKAQVKAQIAEANAAQKMHHKETAFRLEQDRKDASTIDEIARKNAVHHQELSHQAAAQEVKAKEPAMKE